MDEKTLTVTIEGAAAERLAELAALSGRSADWYVAFMIEEYAERERALILDLKAAIKSANEGNVVPHEEAIRRLRAAIDGARQAAAE